ncbi:hypothetical protein [Massilia sp. Root335]|uniref:hypothetical protein n=1 Tax=Massilia sp. Root335 TaxID=1736517 RepID=UPI0006FF4249|nr:hypothetical protein [Massilia sp. Root335]
MHLYSKILSFLLVLLLAGCATGKVDTLAPVDKKEEIVLSEKVSMLHFGVFGSHRWEHIVLPGTYVAERKNTEGVFFFGSGRPIVRITEVFNNNKPHALKGGIFVPNDVSQQPELFYIFEGMTFYQVDDVDAYIAQRTKAELVPTNAKDGMNVALLPSTQSAVNLVNAKPLQAGLGAGLGAGIVAGIIMLDEGNIEFVPRTKDPIVDAKIRAARHTVVAGPTTASAGAN